jgi:hypothetical protein
MNPNLFFQQHRIVDATVSASDFDDDEDYDYNEDYQPCPTGSSLSH